MEKEFGSLLEKSEVRKVDRSRLGFVRSSVMAWSLVKGLGIRLVLAFMNVTISDRDSCPSLENARQGIAETSSVN